MVRAKPPAKTSVSGASGLASANPAYSSAWSALPKWAVIEDWMFDREYKGARLSVGGTANGSRSSFGR